MLGGKTSNQTIRYKEIQKKNGRKKGERGERNTKRVKGKRKTLRSIKKGKK